MDNKQPNNPLHGMTLKTILQGLVKECGWKYLASQVKVKCFMFDPSINSSLKFLRQNLWAREKVEELWIEYVFKK
jgi:uncharacterized protein (DUF2132 family)